jgi:hypothetical protein
MSQLVIFRPKFSFIWQADLLTEGAVRRFCIIFSLFVVVCLAVSGRAETFKLNNGDTITGELLAAAANEQGVQIKVEEGKYEKVPWANFSQDDLKRFRENKKLEPFVEPFIEISQEEKAQKTAVVIKPPPRLERPPKQAVFGALLSSGLGVFTILLLYVGNLYAGYEISIFRARPIALVCGVAAILPIVGPIIFLSMPTRLKKMEDEAEAAEAAAAAAAAAQAAAEGANPMAAEGAEAPAGLHIAHAEVDPKAHLPPTQTFQRGQYTFNRRFFETKFPGFFGVIRRDADKDMVLIIKSARGEHEVQRISRIAANDMHVQVMRGHASEEVTISFQEVQEIRLKHKDA